MAHKPLVDPPKNDAINEPTIESRPSQTVIYHLQKNPSNLSNQRKPRRRNKKCVSILEVATSLDDYL